MQHCGPNCGVGTGQSDADPSNRKLEGRTSDALNHCSLHLAGVCLLHEAQVPQIDVAITIQISIDTAGAR